MASLTPSLIRRKPIALLAAAAAVAVIAIGLGLSGVARAADDEPHFSDHAWSFEGIFGTFDRASLQRGFQVYREVCSACHAMKYLHYRDLAQLGYNDAEIKAIAASVQVQDGPNDKGEMFMRPGKPSDPFKSPFPNDAAARAANGGALPPDLSTIVKARRGGADYVYAVLTGFTKPPKGFKLLPGLYYNAAFPGHQIHMPQPLTDGSVDYKDGTKPTLEQEARDVATFLTWASHPEMEQRKELGFKVLLFVLVLTLLLYGLKRKIWAEIH